MNDGQTLAASDARIDLAGQPLVSRLNLASSAERLALLGEWSPLFRLLSGEAQLTAGSLTLAGVAVPLGVEQGAIGVASLDPLLPATWSAEQFLSSSAELAGVSRNVSRKLAFQTLQHLGLAELAARRLAHLQLAERRALLVAHARLTDPQVLCVEEPLTGLDSHAEDMVLAALDRASVGRRLIVAIGDPEHSAGTRRLLQSCSEHVGLAAGVAISLPAHSKAIARVTATVCRNHHAFLAALTARGLRAHATHEASVLSTLTSPIAGPCWRYLVELAGDSTGPVLDAALESEAGLVELIPLFS